MPALTSIEGKPGNPTSFPSVDDHKMNARCTMMSLHGHCNHHHHDLIHKASSEELKPKTSELKVDLRLGIQDRRRLSRRRPHFFPPALYLRHSSSLISVTDRRWRGDGNPAAPSQNAIYWVEFASRGPLSTTH
ncbi:hypothetical protein AVEN_172306-1 [Araneus ventricosus]|uniref:Uncharacterized protein n=1 Tax=Araneus ventricosus TaxID=182803 RepID=A0A4Y2E571_ARAVE|nr:hypothetical protein AVEN_172306-1 [Araneus ventricosus]